MCVGGCGNRVLFGRVGMRGMEKGVSMSDTTIIFVSVPGKWPKRKTFAYVICMGSQLPSMIRI